jgi:hypothetical protein
MKFVPGCPRSSTTPREKRVRVEHRVSCLRCEGIEIFYPPFSDKQIEIALSGSRRRNAVAFVANAGDRIARCTGTCAVKVIQVCSRDFVSVVSNRGLHYLKAGRRSRGSGQRF